MDTLRVPLLVRWDRALSRSPRYFLSRGQWSRVVAADEHSPQSLPEYPRAARGPQVLSFSYKKDVIPLLWTHEHFSLILVQAMEGQIIPKTRTTNSISLCQFLFIILVLLSSSPDYSCHGARVLEHPQSSTEFIRKSCTSTEYPRLCIASLSAYAPTIQTSPTQLAQTALSLTLSSARSASTTMSKMSTAGGRGMPRRVAGAMKDCMENLVDSVENLRQSVEAMEQLRSGGKKMQGFMINSIQTWVSAALTDDNTCMAGFSGAGAGTSSEVKTTVRSHVVNVAEMTCNALALVSGLASAQSSP